MPSVVAIDLEALALARVWIPGTTLYERILASTPPGKSETAAVRAAWLRMRDALAPWNARISSERRDAAIRKRRKELVAVTQAVAKCLPTLPFDALFAVSQTVAAGELAVLPLDASPSNILMRGEEVTFIDLELLGLDFVDWTYAKYVTTVDKTGSVRSLAARHACDSPLSGLDASITLLALARAAGLWDVPRITLTGLADVLPDRSRATRRIRESLGLESTVRSESG